MESACKPNITSQDRNMFCGTCQRMFFNKSIYDEHLQSHPRKCMVCKKKFDNEEHLEQHILVGDSQLPYKCCTCSMKFKTNRGYLYHCKQHTDDWEFRCSVCNKGFPTRGNFNRHRVVHTKEKPYKCRQCTAKFAYKTSLDNHKQIHIEKEAHRLAWQYAAQSSSLAESTISSASSFETVTSDAVSSCSRLLQSGSKSLLTKSGKSLLRSSQKPKARGAYAVRKHLCARSSKTTTKKIDKKQIHPKTLQSGLRTVTIESDKAQFDSHLQQFKGTKVRSLLRKKSHAFVTRNASGVEQNTESTDVDEKSFSKMSRSRSATVVSESQLNSDFEQKRPGRESIIVLPKESTVSFQEGLHTSKSDVRKSENFQDDVVNPSVNKYEDFIVDSRGLMSFLEKEIHKSYIADASSKGLTISIQEASFETITSDAGSSCSDELQSEPKTLVIKSNKSLFRLPQKWKATRQEVEGNKKAYVNPKKQYLSCSETKTNELVKKAIRSKILQKGLRTAKIEADKAQFDRHLQELKGTETRSFIRKECSASVPRFAPDFESKTESIDKDQESVSKMFPIGSAAAVRDFKSPDDSEQKGPVTESINALPRETTVSVQELLHAVFGKTDIFKGDFVINTSENKSEDLITDSDSLMSFLEKESRKSYIAGVSPQALMTSIQEASIETTPLDIESSCSGMLQRGSKSLLTESDKSSFRLPEDLKATDAYSMAKKRNSPDSKTKSKKICKTEICPIVLQSGLKTLSIEPDKTQSDRHLQEFKGTKTHALPKKESSAFLPRYASGFGSETESTDMDKKSFSKMRRSGSTSMVSDSKLTGDFERSKHLQGFEATETHSEKYSPKKSSLLRKEYAAFLPKYASGFESETESIDTDKKSFSKMRRSGTASMVSDSKSTCDVERSKHLQGFEATETHSEKYSPKKSSLLRKEYAAFLPRYASGFESETESIDMDKKSFSKMRRSGSTSMVSDSKSTGDFERSHHLQGFEATGTRSLLSKEYSAFLARVAPESHTESIDKDKESVSKMFRIGSAAAVSDSKSTDDSEQKKAVTESISALPEEPAVSVQEVLHASKSEVGKTEHFEGDFVDPSESKCEDLITDSDDLVSFLEKKIRKTSLEDVSPYELTSSIQEDFLQLKHVSETGEISEEHTHDKNSEDSIIKFTRCSEQDMPSVPSAPTEPDEHMDMPEVETVPTVSEERVLSNQENLSVPEAEESVYSCSEQPEAVSDQHLITGFDELFSYLENQTRDSGL